MPSIGGKTRQFISITTPAGGGSVGLDIWIGVDPETGCVYMGSEAADICVSNCFSDGTIPTAAMVEDAFIDDSIDIIESFESELKDIANLPWSSYATTIIQIIALVLIIVIVSIINGILSLFPGYGAGA